MLFPIALAVLHDDHAGAKVFLRLLFIYRALMLPGNGLAKVEAKVDVQEELYKWQEHLADKWGKKYPASYNIHVFSHAYQNRKKTGPLYLTSTERYENAYGDARKEYKAGTINCGLQIVDNHMASQAAFHICPGLKRIKIKEKPCSTSDDTIVMVGQDDIYRISKIQEGRKSFTGQKLVKSGCDTSHVGLDLP